MAATLQNITLYTNHSCPYAHRAHITLAELDLAVSETLIDLSTPRPEWYLALNPRGLVPTLQFTSEDGREEVLTESQIVANFLIDASPASHLRAATPLARARQAWFLKTWEDKVAGLMFPAMRASSAAEKQAKCEEWLAVLRQEVEPLLPAGGDGEGRFFGGSPELTPVEIMIAPFLLRFWACAEDGETLPRTFAAQLEALPRLKAWREAIRGRESVMRIYDEQGFVQSIKARLART